MEIAGLPLHPLVVHAAVVLTPLAAVVVAAFAVRAPWRWLTRWPAALLSVGALGAVFAAKVTGTSFLHDRPELAPLVRVHQHRANVLFLLMIAFTVLTLVGTWSLGGATALASGRGARDSRVAVLDRVLPAVLVVGAVLVLVWVVLTGDAGARAVWG